MKKIMYLFRIDFIQLLILCLITPVCYAEIIVIGQKTIISKNTTYSHATLDLTHGSFVIQNNASLSIEHSKVAGVISPENPFLVNVTSGNLVLKNNIFTITAANIPPNPSLPSLYYVINIMQGKIDITDNQFAIDKSYTAGLMATNKFPTTNFIFVNNRINNMHGGILLINSSHALISDNKFTHVSSSNIFILEGSDHLVNGNTILFSGNNNIGDGIDIFDSGNITLSNNNILSGSCYSVFVFHCNNIVIDRNKIIGGITYAIFISGAADLSSIHHEFISKLIGHHRLKRDMNEKITVTNNYLSQNRYGLAVNMVRELTVKNNIFIQRFPDSKNRSFWTNNDILFQAATNVIWENNVYKEGYAQDILDPNPHSDALVSFPLHGGVILG